MLGTSDTAQAGPDDTRASPLETGSRIEVLLTEIAGGTDPATIDRVEQLVRLLSDLYGAGIARILDFVVAKVGPDAVESLAQDALVGGLMMLHDLHPEPVEARIEQALDRLRPHVASAGDVQYKGIDDQGVAHVALLGAKDASPCSEASVRNAIEQAVEAAAPEVLGVELRTVQRSNLLQIGSVPREPST